MRARRTTCSVVLPCLAALLLAVASCVHLARAREHAGAAAHPAATPSVRDRRGAGVRVALPAAWRSLPTGASTDAASWGDATGDHVVTVAATEYGADPLEAVARSVARTLVQRPGVVLDTGPRAVDIGVAPAGDAALVVRYTVTDAHRPGAVVHVAQVWRRDTRASADVVATWTTTDGHWPVDPRASVPAADVR